MANPVIGFVEGAKGLAKNPLGIIALFVSLIYGFACLVLSTSIANLHNEAERLPLIWFIIIFPIVILLAFIFLVTKHHGKLYSPSDYGNAESFLRTIEGAQKFEAIEIGVAKSDSHTGELTISSASQVNLVAKSESVSFNNSLFLPETKENLMMANDFFREYLRLYNLNSYAELAKDFSFGAQAPEYFLLRFVLKKEKLNRPNASSSLEIIIRVTRDTNGVLNMIAIGKNIIESNVHEFAQKVMNYTGEFILRATRPLDNEE
jgi:hypothetical protein